MTAKATEGVQVGRPAARPPVKGGGVSAWGMRLLQPLPPGAHISSEKIAAAGRGDVSERQAGNHHMKGS